MTFSLRRGRIAPECGLAPNLMWGLMSRGGLVAIRFEFSITSTSVNFVIPHMAFSETELPLTTPPRLTHCWINRHALGLPIPGAMAWLCEGNLSAYGSRLARGPGSSLYWKVIWFFACAVGTGWWVRPHRASVSASQLAHARLRLLDCRYRVFLLSNTRSSTL